jgi:hypothetical protein
MGKSIFRSGGCGGSKNFAARVAEVRAKLAPGTPIEVWCQHEMRVGEQTHLSVGPGRAHDPALFTINARSTYLFGAVCPERGTGAALVLS